MQHMTPLRQRIVENIKSEHRTTAKELVALLEKDGLSVNKTTVYRAAEYLASIGTLVKLQFVDMDVMYALAAEKNEYLVCTNCHTIDTVKTTGDEMTHLGAFQIKNKQVIYYGLCKKCAPKNEKSAFSSITSLMGLGSK
ncbi:MAG TPA: transcriptional repressor [Candidatus Saccharimonadia bacterium]|nr:transcriptional repressor [Candidatus Saccharimonadia bacterium]